MFGFLKKKENEEKASVEPVAPQYSEEELLSFKNTIEKLESETDTHLGDASYYEELGLLYNKVNNIEAAINALEKSLEIELSMGEGYKKLMNLYNQKRKEAAIAHDDTSIDYYMGKMDDMRNIAKKVTLTVK